MRLYYFQLGCFVIDPPVVELLSAWMPISSTEGAYLQVNLNTIMAIHQLYIKGRKGGNQWIKQFQLMHSLDEELWETFMSPYGTIKVRINTDDMGTFLS